MRKWACSDLCTFFIPTPRNSRKNKPIFTGRINCESSDLLPKIVNPFRNHSKVQYPGLTKFCQKKPSKFMSSKNTHLIPSNLALAVWRLMMLLNRQTVLYFVVCLWSNMFVIINCLHNYGVCNTTSTSWLINILSAAISCSL